MPKQFVAPCLNTFRVKDSNSTYARTKVPAYLKAAAPDLKQTVNWGKLTPETKPEVEANHTQLVYRLGLLDAQLREGNEPAPVAPQRAAPADLPASVTELVERFIEREGDSLRREVLGFCREFNQMQSECGKKEMLNASAVIKSLGRTSANGWDVVEQALQDAHAEGLKDQNYRMPNPTGFMIQLFKDVNDN